MNHIFASVHPKWELKTEPIITCWADQLYLPSLQKYGEGVLYQSNIQSAWGTLNEYWIPEQTWAYLQAKEYPGLVTQFAKSSSRGYDLSEFLWVKHTESRPFQEFLEVILSEVFLTLISFPSEWITSVCRELLLKSTFFSLLHVVFSMKYLRLNK